MSSGTGSGDHVLSFFGGRQTVGSPGASPIATQDVLHNAGVPSTMNSGWTSRHSVPSNTCTGESSRGVPTVTALPTTLTTTGTSYTPTYATDIISDSSTSFASAPLSSTSATSMLSQLLFNQNSRDCLSENPVHLTLGSNTERASSCHGQSSSLTNEKLGHDKGFYVPNKSAVRVITVISTTSTSGSSGSLTTSSGLASCSTQNTTTITSSSRAPVIHRALASNALFEAYIVPHHPNARVIHKITSSTRLIKGHTGTMVDITFVSESSTFLLTCATDGCILLHTLGYCEVGCTLQTSIIGALRMDTSFDCVPRGFVPCVPQDARSDGEVMRHQVLIRTTDTRLKLFALHEIAIEPSNTGLEFTPWEECDVPYVSLGDEVGEFCVTTEGNRVAVVEKNSSVAIYLIPSPARHATWKPHGGDLITALAFASKSYVLITCAQGGTQIKLWNIAEVTPQCVQSLVLSLPPPPRLPLSVVDSDTASLLKDEKGSDTVHPMGNTTTEHPWSFQLNVGAEKKFAFLVMNGHPYATMLRFSQDGQFFDAAMDLYLQQPTNFPVLVTSTDSVVLQQTDSHHGGNSGGSYSSTRELTLMLRHEDAIRSIVIERYAMEALARRGATGVAVGGDSFRRMDGFDNNGMGQMGPSLTTGGGTATNAVSDSNNVVAVLARGISSPNNASDGLRKDMTSPRTLPNHNSASTGGKSFDFTSLVARLAAQSSGTIVNNTSPRSEKVPVEVSVSRSSPNTAVTTRTNLTSHQTVDSSTPLAPQTEVMSSPAITTTSSRVQEVSSSSVSRETPPVVLQAGKRGTKASPVPSGTSTVHPSTSALVGSQPTTKSGGSVANNNLLRSQGEDSSNPKPSTSKKTIMIEKTVGTDHTAVPAPVTRSVPSLTTTPAIIAYTENGKDNEQASHPGVDHNKAFPQTSDTTSQASNGEHPPVVMKSKNDQASASSSTSISNNDNLSKALDEMIVHTNVTTHVIIEATKKIVQLQTNLQELSQQRQAVSAKQGRDSSSLTTGSAPSGASASMIDIPAACIRMTSIMDHISSHLPGALSEQKVKDTVAGHTGSTVQGLHSRMDELITTQLNTYNTAMTSSLRTTLVDVLESTRGNSTSRTDTTMTETSTLDNVILSNLVGIRSALDCKTLSQSIAKVTHAIRTRASPVIRADVHKLVLQGDLTKALSFVLEQRDLDMLVWLLCHETTLSDWNKFIMDLDLSPAVTLALFQNVCVLLVRQSEKNEPAEIPASSGILDTVEPQEWIAFLSQLVMNYFNEWELRITPTVYAEVRSVCVEHLERYAACVGGLDEVPDARVFRRIFRLLGHA